MNRKERRFLEKQLRHNGNSKLEAKQLVANYFANPALKKGDKVKINYELMIRHPDWKKQRDDFKKWVGEHKDSIFTVGNDGIQVVFEEDTTNPKWVFNSVTLTSLPVAKVKLNSGETKEIVIDNLSDFTEGNIVSSINEALNDKEENENG